MFRSAIPVIAGIIIPVLLSGCAFPKVTATHNRTVQESLNQVKGEYMVKALATQSASPQQIDFHSAVHKFFPGQGRGRSKKADELKCADCTFLIDSITPDDILIVFLRNGTPVDAVHFKWRVKENGMLYLRKRNFKFWGIPYLFGGIDVKRLRLSVDAGNNLVIEDIHHSSGAVLLIFGDSKTWYHKEHYARISR